MQPSLFPTPHDLALPPTARTLISPDRLPPVHHHCRADAPPDLSVRSIRAVLFVQVHLHVIGFNATHLRGKGQDQEMMEGLWMGASPCSKLKEEGLPNRLGGAE